MVGMGKSNNNSDPHAIGYRETMRVYYPLLFFFALLLLLFFPHLYPQASYPLRALFIVSGIIIVLIGLVVMGWKGVKISRESLILLYLYGLFLAWCLLRNAFSPVPAFGRPFLGSVLQGFWVIAAVLLVLALEKSPGSSEEHPFGLKTPPTHDFEFQALSLRSLVVFYFILMAVVFSIQGIYQYFIGFDRQLEIVETTGLFQGDDRVGMGIVHALKERRVFGGFGNPNLFAAFLSMITPFLLILLVKLRKTLIRVILLVGLLLVFFVVILTRSRGGLLSWLCAVCLFFLFHLPARKNISSRIFLKRIIPVILLFAIVGGLFLIIQSATRTEGIEGGSFVERFFSSSTIQQRMFYLKSGGAMIARNPLLGNGPGSYGILYPRYRCLGSWETQNAHNVIIQLWADVGVVGLILFFLFVGYAFRTALSRLRRTELTIPILVLFLVFLLNSLFEYSFYHRSLFLDFCLSAALLVGGSRSYREGPKGRKPILKGLTRSYLQFAWPVALSLVFIPNIILKPMLGAVNSQFGDDAVVEGQMERALGLYQKAAGYQPDNPWYHQRVGQTHLRLGAPDKAESSLTKALELNPFSASLRDELAQFYRSSFRLEEAVALEREATRAYPLNSTYHYRLARFLLETGEKEESRKAVREAIRVELDPFVKESYLEFLKKLEKD